MDKLKIPKASKGISKTLRIPSNVINELEILAKIKNNSLNKTVIYLLEFSLNKLDKKEIEKLKQFKENI